MSKAPTLFYAWDSATDAPPPAMEPPPGVTPWIWRPAMHGPPPAELSGWQNKVWWLFDRLGVFPNRHCGVFGLRANGRLVHTSLVTPRYFRFPDMGVSDLQIGATWTDPDMRGQGLAKVAVAMIHDAWRGEFQRMWYLVGEDNTASIRVIEASGYRLVGTGRRDALPGLGFMGRYRIRTPRI